MNFHTDKSGGVIRISGILDIDAAPALREALLGCQPELSATPEGNALEVLPDPALPDLISPALTVDLSEVESCDTASLQILLASRFRLADPSAAIAEIACALGLNIPSLNIPDLNIPEEVAHAA